MKMRYSTSMTAVFASIAIFLFDTPSVSAHGEFVASSAGINTNRSDARNWVSRCFRIPKAEFPTILIWTGNIASQAFDIIGTETEVKLDIVYVAKEMCNSKTYPGGNNGINIAIKGELKRRRCGADHSFVPYAKPGHWLYASASCARTLHNDKEEINVVLEAKYYNTNVSLKQAINDVQLLEMD